MEVTTSLLVVLMFVGLLTIGIANILMSLASIVNRSSDTRVAGIHLSWIILMLMFYFNVFWHSLSILTAGEWDFVGFLYIEAGPILALFATQVLLPADGIGPDSTRDRYFAISPQYFLLFAMVQTWVVGSDFVLGNGFTTASFGNVAGIGIAVALMLSRSYRVHVTITVAVWALFVVVAVGRVAAKTG